MNHLRPKTFIPCSVVLGLVFGSVITGSAQLPSLTDFGYQSMKVNTELPLGQRRCLIVLIDLSGNPTPMFAFHPAGYYENLVFNPLAPRIDSAVPPSPGSVNAYLAENSDSRFTLTRAIGAAHPTGSLGPLLLTQQERDAIAADNDNDKEAIAALAAATRAGLVLSDFDINNDKFVSETELMLLVVTSSAGDGGKTRGASYKPPGSDTTFVGRYCSVNQQVSFATLTHELSHVFGTLDLYYGNGTTPRYYLGRFLSLNNFTTLMGITITGPDDAFSFHLDPWHKMALGWSEPRLVSMRVGGVFPLPAARTQTPDAPILLWDSLHGTNEYFLLEYRTTNRAAGALTDSYDSNVATEGLFLWHVQQDPDHTLPKVDSPFDFTSDTNGMVLADLPFANWVEGPPNPAAGNAPTPNVAWQGGQTTYALRWNDAPTWSGRSSSPTHLRVRPFARGDDQIWVEVFSNAETWVDFAHAGTETGEIDTPYNTLAEGVAFVAHGGRLSLKPGTADPTPVTLIKPMTLQAPFGAVHIGP